MGLNLGLKCQCEEAMSLIHADSFDNISTLSLKYTTVGVVLSTTQRRFGTGQSVRGSYGNYLVYTLPSSVSELYIGLAVYFDTETFSAPGSSLYFFGGGGAQNGAFAFLGQMLYIRNNINLLVTSVKGIKSYVWNFIEIKFKASDSSSSGDVQVKVNGETIYSCAAGIDFHHSNNPDSNTHGVVIGFPTASGQYWYIEDLYVCDSSGSVNNTFLGDCRIQTLYPSGNGNSSQFMGSDADQTDNYLLVDEAQPDDDTTYVYDDTVDQVDLYAFDNIDSNVDTIHGVVADACMKKTDAGSRTARIMCRSGGSNYEGAELFPGTNYGHYPQIWETDPDTASAWTETGINAAEFGLTIEA